MPPVFLNNNLHCRVFIAIGKESVKKHKTNNALKNINKAKAACLAQTRENCNEKNFFHYNFRVICTILLEIEINEN